MKFLVIGDCFVDVLIKAREIPAEEATEGTVVYKSNQWLMAPGGAANVAKQLREIAKYWSAEETTEVTVFVPYNFPAEGLDEIDAWQFTWLKSHIRQRIEVDGSRICRIDVNADIDAKEFDKVKGRILSSIRLAYESVKPSTIILCDHGYVPSLMRAFVEFFTNVSDGVLVFYDGTIRRRPEIIPGPTIYKFNEWELAQWPFMKSIRGLIVETRGSQPTRIWQEGEAIEVPLPAQLNPKGWEYSGCGDAFVAALAWYTSMNFHSEAVYGVGSIGWLKSAVRFAQEYAIDYMLNWHRRYKDFTNKMWLSAW